MMQSDTENGRDELTDIVSDAFDRCGVDTNAVVAQLADGNIVIAFRHNGRAQATVLTMQGAAALAEMLLEVVATGMMTEGNA